jgi:hypothetical protein
MPWPFSGPFAPLLEGYVDVRDREGERQYRLHVIGLGELRVDSGRLLACDPFVTLPEGVVAEIDPGTYPVSVTVADVSEDQNGSHLREAYLSLVISEAASDRHAPIVPMGKQPPDPNQFYGVPVDAGTVAFVDEVSARTLMPDENWFDELFDTGQPDSWFAQVDAGAPLPPGYANIVLPLATRGENIIISHSGWGDGFYPVIGSYDAQGRLTGIHIDLEVVGDFID